MHDLVAVSPVDRRILGLVQPVVVSMGYDLVRLRYGGGKEKTLQIMVDKVSGTIGIEDCGTVSRAVSALLDVEMPDLDSFTLEVSSPGIDRPLTRLGDFGDWIGHLAKFETSVPIEGRRRFKGLIQGVEGQTIQIDEAGAAVEVDFDSLASARLVLTDELIAAGTDGQSPKM